MQRTPMSRSSIARLNQIARRIERQMDDADGPQAVVEAAREYGLIKVKEYDQSGVLYRTPRNRYVFGWMNHSTLAAGAGFDDQIEDEELDA